MHKTFFLIQFYLGVLVLMYLLCLFCITNVDDLLTVHLSIVLGINQLDVQNLVNKILCIKLVNY